MNKQKKSQHNHQQDKNTSPGERLDAAQGEKTQSRLALQRALVAPNTLKPVDVLHLQRSIGNRATVNTIQRYFKHTPTAPNVTGTQFEAQEKADGDKSFVDATTKKTTIKTPTGVPQLRVSNDGRMAIEDTDLSKRQAKVFYADSALVKESNARLLETGSKFQLFVDQPNVLKVPNSKGSGQQTLSRVLPRNLASFDSDTGTYGDEGLTMDVQATCDEVAQTIVQTGNIGDYPVLKKSIKTAIGFGELNVAGYLLAREKGKNPKQSLLAANKALELGDDVEDERQARTAVRIAEAEAKQREFAEQNPGAKASDEDIERIAKKDRERAEGQVRSEMERELKQRIADAYGRLLVQQPVLAHALSAELGINRHAMPEVGQAFGSILMQGTTKNFDFAANKVRTQQEGGVWGSHYGGVVAKSGGDMVTLENYARNRENEGIQDATSQMYYFQMYGSEVGQTWHETWAAADRRVINPLTQVMGKSHKEIWPKQLDGIPAMPGVPDTGGYAASLTDFKQRISDTDNRDEAMRIYRSGMLNLVVNRFRNYAQQAHDLAVESGLAGPFDEFRLRYDFVVPKLDAWIAAAASKRDRIAKIRFKKRRNLASLSAQLTQFKKSIVDVQSYYADRFPTG